MPKLSTIQRAERKQQSRERTNEKKRKERLHKGEDGYTPSPEHPWKRVWTR
jgi:hypothetical protein